MQTIPATHWLQEYSRTSDPLDAQRLTVPQLCQHERALRVAVIERAWLDLSLHSGATRAHAAFWVFDDDESYPFAFVPLCEVLGLSVAALRESCLRTLGRDGELVRLRCALPGCTELFQQAHPHQRFCGAVCQRMGYHLRRRRQQGLVEPFRHRERRAA